MDEDLFRYFSDSLSIEGANTTIILAKFYCKALDVKLTQDIIKIFAKLKKMYGASTVFNAIVQAYDMPSLSNKDSGAYGILAFFCKKELKDTLNTPKLLLTDTINENKLRKQELVKHQLIIPKPFDEGEV